RAKNLFEDIVAESFPNMKKETEILILQAQSTPNKINPRRLTPRHIVIKIGKNSDKERILKLAREKKKVKYKGNLTNLSADLSTETWQARKKWQEIFNMMNRKNMQPRILYPASLSFRIEGEIKVFPNKQKLKEFITTKPALQEILRGIL
ncbi:LORF1 protein, partial [Crocuta crocuta]